MNTDTELRGIARLSKEDPKRTFYNLVHMFNEETLEKCFDMLDGKKAVGEDGTTKEMYEENLYRNLEDLVCRLERMAYRPGAVRLAMIPKEGKPGAKRPLGISNFEDKIVQKQMQRILESIYEPIFLKSSFGFRPGMGCHDAIKALRKHLYNNEVQVVIDIDLANFFGTIDHKMLEEILRKRIKDKTLMRYIIRMFKAGVLADGELTISNEGVPQGSICSPILANIYAHYVIDMWIEEMVKPNCEGKVEFFRYADDAVICCEQAKDAKRIIKTLDKRLAKFKLKLNKEKTKMVLFSKREMAKGKQQGAFDFLGFTFYLGRTVRGDIIPRLRTSGKKFRAKLKNVNEWCKTVRNRYKLKEIWKRFNSKIRGHIQYYGVTFNSAKVGEFLYRSVRTLFKWLNRRSQRRSFGWEEFSKFMGRNPMPKARVVHSLIR